MRVGLASKPYGWRETWLCGPCCCRERGSAVMTKTPKTGRWRPTRDEIGRLRAMTCKGLGLSARFGLSSCFGRCRSRPSPGLAVGPPTDGNEGVDDGV